MLIRNTICALLLAATPALADAPQIGVPEADQAAAKMAFLMSQPANRGMFAGFSNGTQKQAGRWASTGMRSLQSVEAKDPMSAGKSRYSLIEGGFAHMALGGAGSQRSLVSNKTAQMSSEQIRSAESQTRAAPFLKLNALP